MAREKLVQCKHCGGTIAHAAKTCPHCGGKLKKSKIMRFIGFVIKLFLLIALITISFLAGVCFTLIAQDSLTRLSDLDMKISSNISVDVSDIDQEGVDVSFMQAMDKFEDFIDEYVAFMEVYSASDNTIPMMMKYTTFALKYADTMHAIENIDESKLSEADYNYYIKVMMSINNKLAKAAYAME